MGKPETFSNRIWNGESLSFRVIATEVVFTVRQKYDRYRCVRGFAVFQGNRQMSRYRILTREDLENWLDTGELAELKSGGRPPSESS